MALRPRVETGDPVSEFIHDLNNPLGAVHANLSQMAEYLEDLRQVWERVEAVREAVRVEDALTRDLAAGALAERIQATGADFLVEDLRAAVQESLAGVSEMRRLLREGTGTLPRSTDS